ncbi:MAG: flippase [Candidatus Micrarchaeota archaeon]
MESEEAPDYSKEVAKGSFWGLAGSIFFKLVSFFYVILIARMASPDDVGIFYLSIGILGIISIVSDLGLPNSLQRYVPFFEGKGEKRKIGGIFVSSYILSGLGALVFTVLVWAGADIFASLYQSAPLADAMRVLSVYVLFYCFLKINTVYLQGRGDIKSMQMISNLQNILKLVLTIAAFYLFGASVVTLTGAFTLSVALTWALSFIPVSGRLADIPIKLELPETPLLKELVYFGFMLTIVQSFWFIIAATDKLLIGYLLPDSAELIAIYSLAANLAFVLTTLPGAIEVAFFPTISRAVGRGQPAEIRSIVSTVQRWMFLITIPLAIVMMLFAGDFLDFLYGDLYRSGAAVMAILTFSFLLKSVSSPLLITLAAKRLVLLELGVMAAVASLNLALNVLLIPRYGIGGAAWATLGGFISMAILLVFYSRRTFGFTISPDLLKITLAGVLAFAAILLLEGLLSSVVGLLPALHLGGELDTYVPKLIYLAYASFLMAISLLVFMAMSMLLKCLHPDDLELMRKIMLRAGIPRAAVDKAMGIASLGVSGGG